MKLTSCLASAYLPYPPCLSSSTSRPERRNACQESGLQSAAWLSNSNFEFQPKMHLKSLVVYETSGKPMVVEIQGTLFDVVFKKSPKGNMIVTKKPDMSKVKWSQAQTKQRQRFKQGIAAVKKALENPQVRARYERKAK